jgi:hypothetical protein
MLRGIVWCAPTGRLQREPVSGVCSKPSPSPSTVSEWCCRAHGSTISTRFDKRAASPRDRADHIAKDRQTETVLYRGQASEWAHLDSNHRKKIVRDARRAPNVCHVPRLRPNAAKKSRPEVAIIRWAQLVLLTHRLRLELQSRARASLGNVTRSPGRLA